MLLKDTFSIASRAVVINKSRALLTMLGIIIGVAAVVLMSSIGQSMTGVILSQISSLGAKTMVIFPGTGDGGPSAMLAGHDSLTFSDIEQLKKLSSIKMVAPVITLSGKASYGREEASPQVLGITPDFFLNQSITTAEGRLIDEADNNGDKKVAVIAPDAADKLFGQTDPLGKSVKVGSESYLIIGTTKALGSQFFQSADERIYVPFNVARDVSSQKFVNYLTMQATADFDTAFADVKYVLRKQHRIDNPADDPKKDDFVVRSSEQASQILGTVSTGLTAFITTIATISLLVGGIGIMNIMLVSVTERTREIGLRKAVGAKGHDILLQFLIESVVLTALGGIIGMVIGIGGAYLISFPVRMFLGSYAFAVSIPAMIAAFLMAAVTGLVFGITPARRAAGLNPIEALRYE